MTIPQTSPASQSKPTDGHPSVPRPSRRGFTLIEILLVFTIIVVLVAMLFGAYNLVIRHSKERDTLTMLQTVQSMFDNYKQATHLNKPLPDLSAAQVIWPAAVGSVNNPTGAITPWVQTQAAFATSYWSVGWVQGGVMKGETAPGVITIDYLTGTVINKNYLYFQNDPAIDPEITGSLPPSGLPQQLVDTICVMYAMEQLPDNKTMIANLPSSRTLTLPIAVGTTTNSVTLLLDGWGNPILFVPGIGLYGLDSKSALPNYSTSATYNQGDSVIYQYADPNPKIPPHNFLYTCVAVAGVMGVTPPAPPPPTVPPPPTGPQWGGYTAPGLRNYWVSGGPDGNISTHDDNIYSFNQ